MPGKNNVSTYRPRIFDSTLPHKSPTSSEDPSTSGLSFKSDRSKENIIYFKEGSSTLMADCSHSSEEEEGAADDDDDDDVQSSDRLPEQHRPESAGRRMTGRRNRSADRLRSNDIWDTPPKRLKRSSMSEIHDFKESSNLSPELQRPESAGRRMTGRRNRSADRLRSNDKCDISDSEERYMHFKKSSSLREKDTSLSTTPEIVVAGGMETS